MIAEALVPFETVKQVLKCEPKTLVELFHAKLLTGSSAAVCIGGSNAHAANISFLKKLLPKIVLILMLNLFTLSRPCLLLLDR